METPPKFWKSYWGKFYDDKGPEGCKFPNITLPEEFWDEYFEKHPNGHDEDETESVQPQHCWDDSKHGYWMIKGQLCYKHPNGRVYLATGVDEF